MEKNFNPHLKIVFFDGVCHLCNSFVDRLIQKDTHHELYFAPLQGETAKKVLASLDRETLDTIIFYDNGRVLRRSDAILGILKSAGYPLLFLRLSQILPMQIRDIAYNILAKYRYKIFGKNDFCRIPLESEKKFLLP